MQRYVGLCIRSFYLKVSVLIRPSVIVCVCAQVVTRHVWDAWAAVLLVVRNVLAATD